VPAPEFTIPVCLHHIGTGRNRARRYGYVGTVFRQRRAGGNEFLQAGIEDIGDTDSAAADARSLADALAFLKALDVTAKTVTTLGDQAVFNAVVTGLGLPQSWAVRLSHAFGDRDTLRGARRACRSLRRRRRCRPTFWNRARRATGPRWSMRFPCGCASRGLKIPAGATRARSPTG
jgi:ATP phosphoribosyltransferase regulatory subunit HisZ